MACGEVVERTVGPLPIGASESGATTFLEVLRSRFVAEPERVALHFLSDDDGIESVRCGALDAVASRVAAALQRRVSAGERVALLLPPGRSFVAGFLGCVYAGCIAVPLYPPRPGEGRRRLERLASVLDDCRPAAVLSTDALLGLQEELDDVTGAASAASWLALDALESAEAVEWREPVLRASSTAFLQYTSGSVGDPAGVVISHANLVSQHRILERVVGTTPESVVVSWLPPYHDMGLIGTILHPLAAGCLGVLLSPIDFLARPVRWLRALTRYGGTHSVAPNFGYELAARRVTAAERRDLDLRRWRVALNGAEPVRADTLDRFAATFQEAGFRREAFVPCYGLAEATLLVTATPVGRGARSWAVSSDALSAGEVEPSGREARTVKHVVGCGAPAPATEVVVVAPGTVDPCPAGRVGEILVAGPSVAAGYWGAVSSRRLSLADRLVDGRRGPFLRTGDLGFWRDGELVVTGRANDVLKVRGRKIYPQDLERTVARCHPAMRDGCTAAFSLDVDGEERVVVVQEVRTDSLAPAELVAIGRAAQGAVLEEHDVRLHELVLIPARALPKTSSGKVRRQVCRAALEAGELPVVARPLYRSDAAAGLLPRDEAPVTAEPASKAVDERTIADWLTEHLVAIRGLEPGEVGPSTRFVDLGVDSAEAALLSWEVEEWLGRSVPLTLIWDHPTVEALARHLASRSDDATVVDEASPLVSA